MNPRQVDQLYFSELEACYQGILAANGIEIEEETEAMDAETLKRLGVKGFV